MAYKREKDRTISSYLFTSRKHKNIIQHKIHYSNTASDNPTGHNKKRLKKVTVEKVFIYKALKTLLTDVLVHFLQIWEKIKGLN